MLQPFYHINIKNKEKCIIQKYLYLGTFKMIIKFYYLQCIRGVGVNFRNSNEKTFTFFENIM